MCTCRKRANVASVRLWTSFPALTAQTYQSHRNLWHFKAWWLCIWKLATSGCDVRKKPFQRQTSSELKTWCLADSFWNWDVGEGKGSAELHPLLREMLSNKISSYWKQQNLFSVFTLKHRSSSKSPKPNSEQVSQASSFKGGKNSLTHSTRDGAI